MQKKLLIGAAVALFLGAGVFTATSLTQKEQISDLTLANIEAIAKLGDEDNPIKIGCCDVNYPAVCKYNIRTVDGQVSTVIRSGAINC